jgi:hypothetical protein
VVGVTISLKAAKVSKDLNKLRATRPEKTQIEVRISHILTKLMRYSGRWTKLPNMALLTGQGTFAKVTATAGPG